jgi:aldehyde:ferredoxin oxidoreductase
MPYGYHGKILHVDLTNASIKVERPDGNFYRKYLGGSAFGLYYALRKIPPKADPLGQENVLILALSELTGVPISGQSRMNFKRPGRPTMAWPVGTKTRVRPPAKN